MNCIPPTVRRILESSLYVDSLEHSANFYFRVFGFKTMLRDERMCALAVPEVRSFCFSTAADRSGPPRLLSERYPRMTPRDHSISAFQ